MKKIAWKLIAPVPITYNDNRTYLKFQKNWTDIFYYAIREKDKLPCPISFKKAQFFKLPGFPYFSCPGKCPECLNTVAVVCREKPDLDNCDPVEVEIVTRNTENIYHYRRRKLKGARREKLKGILNYIKVKHYKDREAALKLTDSGKGIELLSHSYVYQKIRQEARDEDYGADKYPGNAIESKHLMMQDFSDIREFSTSPLIMHYWLDSQISLVSEASKLDVPITIDASRRFIIKVLNRDGQRSSHLFLYVIVIRFDGKIYPVGQMISERHDVATIGLWLIEWVQSILQQPVECRMKLSLTAHRLF